MGPKHRNEWPNWRVNWSECNKLPSHYKRTTNGNRIKSVHSNQTRTPCNVVSKSSNNNPSSLTNTTNDMKPISPKNSPHAKRNSNKPNKRKPKTLITTATLSTIATRNSKKLRTRLNARRPWFVNIYLRRLSHKRPWNTLIVKWLIYVNKWLRVMPD